MSLLDGLFFQILIDEVLYFLEIDVIILIVFRLFIFISIAGKFGLCNLRLSDLGIQIAKVHILKFIMIHLWLGLGLGPLRTRIRSPLLL